MSIFAIFCGSVGLTLGSLLVAGLLGFAAWWLADRIHLSWITWLILLVLYTGMLLSPLKHSLFVQMTAAFGLVTAALLYFRPREDKTKAD
jgi:hypothetical protein